MKADELKILAAQQGIKVGKMKKNDVVRLIQQNEGNAACFDTGNSMQCGQEHCLWRGDCA